MLSSFPAHAVNDEAIRSPRPPQQLSEFAFFSDIAAQTPVEGVLPFALNTPLFSDGAIKDRFVYVPPGKQAFFSVDEAFDFPVGTALIKTFSFRLSTATRPKRIETRLLLRNETGWQAWAYLWNDKQNDAVLKITGAKVDIATVDEGGSAKEFVYSVPNKNQCKACHALSGEIVPIGPKARNLDGDFAYPDGSANQLKRWIGAGILDRLPAIGPRKAPDWLDEAQPLDARARAWLDVNCAHCHRAEGPASNSGLFLTFGETDPVKLGVGKRPVAAGRGSGGRLFDIVPGDPDASILVYRVESEEPGIMMPELGRHIGDPKAVALLRRWISEMK